MAEVIDEKAPLKLGAGFWTVWLAAGAAIFVGFGIGAWLFAAKLHSTVGLGALVIAFTCSFWLLSMVPWYLRRRRGAEGRMRAPAKRYMLRFMPAMLVYVVVLMASAQINMQQHPTGWPLWALAIAPAVPVLFAIRALWLFYREQDDDYERARMASAFIWATCATLAVCMVWGLLETFSLVPHVWLWAVMPLWAVFLGVAQIMQGAAGGRTGWPV